MKRCAALADWFQDQWCYSIGQLDLFPSALASSIFIYDFIEQYAPRLLHSQPSWVMTCSVNDPAAAGPPSSNPSMHQAKEKKKKKKMFLAFQDVELYGAECVGAGYDFCSAPYQIDDSHRHCLNECVSTEYFLCCYKSYMHHVVCPAPVDADGSTTNPIGRPRNLAILFGLAAIRHWSAPPVARLFFFFFIRPANNVLGPANLFFSSSSWRSEWMQIRLYSSWLTWRERTRWARLFSLAAGPALDVILGRRRKKRVKEASVAALPHFIRGGDMRCWWARSFSTRYIAIDFV